MKYINTVLQMIRIYKYINYTYQTFLTLNTR